MKIQTTLNEKDFKFVFKKPLTTMLCVMLIGALGLACYVLIGTIFETANLDFLLVFSIPFALGLVAYVLLKRQLRKVSESPVVYNFEFNDADFSVEFTQFGSQIKQTHKIGDIKNTKEYDEYFFIYIQYLSTKIAYVIKKSDVDGAELEKIKQRISSEKK